MILTKHGVKRSVSVSSKLQMILHEPCALFSISIIAYNANNDLYPSIRVREFVQHASEFGFFLHIHRFLDKVYTQANRNNSSLTILLNVIYLLGARLSRDPQIRSQEQGFLSRALQHIPTALPEDPQGAIYVMQAEVLLANYFFNGSRQLEGVYHTNAAVSIAMASKLHLIRSNRRSRSTAEANSYRLPPPADALEEGERINGFWTVFILDRCWAIASGSAPAFTDDESTGTQIDTPWPMDLGMYQSVSSRDQCGTLTIVTETNGFDDASTLSPETSARRGPSTLLLPAHPPAHTRRARASWRFKQRPQFCMGWRRASRPGTILVGTFLFSYRRQPLTCG